MLKNLIPILDVIIDGQDGGFLAGGEYEYAKSIQGIEGFLMGTELKDHKGD